MEDKMWNGTGVCKLGDVSTYSVSVHNHNVYFSTVSKILKADNRQPSLPPKLELYDTPTRKCSPSCFVLDKKGIFIYLWNNATKTIDKYDTRTKKLSVVVGNGKCGYTDGSFQNAQFKDPNVMITDKRGDILLGECTKIRKIYFRKGIVETIAGTDTLGHKDGDVKFSRFRKVHGIALGDYGNIYVSDELSHCIRLISGGDVSTLAGGPEAGERDGPFDRATFKNPKGLVHLKNSLIVCDGNDCLRKLDLATRQVTTIQFKEKIQFPIGLTLASDQSCLFVAALANVLRIPLTGWKWSMVKLLWIGKLKEESEYCLIAKLPRELVNEIAKMVSWYVKQSK